LKFPLSAGYLNEGYSIKNSNTSSDPWHFIVMAKVSGTHSSIGKYRAYVLSEDKYIPLPVLYQRGLNSYVTCSTGYPACSWEESYIIPTAIVDKTIESHAALKFFFKYEGSKAGPNLESINERDVVPKTGSVVEIKADYVAAFVSKILSEVGR
jgi:hypothetical protein